MASVAVHAQTPDPPSSFKATPGNGQVTLSWEDPVDNGGFPIERYDYRVKLAASETEGPWQNVGLATEVIVLSLTNGELYEFHVRAWNGGELSETAQAFATPVGPPSKPGGLTAANASPPDGTILLTWTAPTSNGGAAISTYEYSWTRADGITSVWTAATAQLTTVVTGLTTGLGHTFEVRAVNDGGETGPASDAATATPVTTPEMPEGLTAAAGDGSVTLSWTAPATGGLPIRRYEYSLRKTAVAAFGPWRSAGAEITVVVPSLDNADEYVFQVRAVTCCLGGAGEVLGAVAEAKATPRTTPAAPSQVEAAPGDGVVVLTWEPPVSDGGAAVEGYDYRWRAGGRAWVPWVSAGDVRTVMVESLTNGEEHTFELAAVNAAGRGAVVERVAVPSTTADMPADLVAVAGDSSVELTWKAPADTGGLPVARYDYRFAPAGGAFGWWESVGGCRPGDGTAGSGAAVRTRCVTTTTITGLKNGVTYDFEVRAVTQRPGSVAMLGKVATASATPLGSSAGPSGLTAVPGNGNVTLSWKTPLATGGSDISGYAYRFRPEGGGFSAWTSMELAETVVVDELDNGVEYRFEVRAETDAGGGVAAVVDATPRTVPEVPEGLAAQSGAGSVLLEWQPPRFDGGAAIERYEFRFKEAGETFNAWEGVELDTSASIQGLTDGVEYVFEVRAVNVAGDGTAAEAAAVPRRTSDAPGSLTATPRDGAVVLEWTVPANDGGAAVESYEYRWRAQGSAFTDWQSVDVDETATTVDGLTNGVPYVFEVRVINAVGGGVAAVAETTPTPAPTPPSAPRDLRVAAADGRLTLRWSSPSSNGGAPIARYEYRYGVATEALGDWTNAGLQGVATIRDLVNGTTYRVEVRAVNAIDGGVAASVEGKPQAAPGAPENLASAVGDRSVTLQWDAPLEDGGLPILRYEYRFGPAAAGVAGASWSDAGLKTTQTVQGLDNGNTYLFEVRTVNTALPGPPAIVSATPGTGPDAPDVTATAGDGEVVLTWPTPAALGGADLLRYEYRVQSAGGLFGGWASVGLATTTTVRGLTNDIDYAFEVRGVNKFGAGTPGRATAKPRVAVAPAAPEVAAEAGDGKVTLSWELSDDGGAPVRRYEYRWQPESGAFGQWNSANLDAAATVSGLVNGVAYTFEVRAVNDVGAGEASAADATPARVPGAPELVARANSRAVELSWGEPGDGGSPIDGYAYRWGPEDEALSAWEDIGRQTALTVRGLENGTTYAFEVRATNAMGHGAAGSATATPSPNLPDDVLAQAWLSRFGRASAEHVVDAVAARAVAPARNGASVRPREVDRPRPRSGRRPATGRVTHRGGQNFAGAPGHAMHNAGMAGVGGHRLPSQAGRSAWDTVLGAAASAGPPTVLWLSSSSRSSPSGPRGAGEGAWAAWGRVSGTRFAGEQGAAAVDGGVVTGTLGADYRRGRLLAGIALSHSSGRGGFRQLERDGYPERVGDDVSSQASGIYPYMRYQGNWLSGWALLGGARGTMTLTGDGPETTGTFASVLGAAGAAGQLITLAGVDFGIRADAFLTGLATTGDELADIVTSTSRMRFGLEASRAFVFDSGGALAATFDLGGRHDSGDAERGLGFDVGGGFRYVAPSRLTIEARGRTIVGHMDEAFQNWSGMVSVLADAGGAGPDLAVQFGPSWSADELWRTGLPDGRHGNPGGARVDAEFGWGFTTRSGDGMFRPYAAMRVDGGRNDYRLGLRRTSPAGALELTGVADGTERLRYGVLLRATVRPHGERLR